MHPSPHPSQELFSEKFLMGDPKIRYLQVRVADDLIERVQAAYEEHKAATGDKRPQYAFVKDLVETGLQAEKQKRQPQRSNADLTPQETELIEMVLAFMRQPQDSVETGILSLIRNVYGNRR